MKEKGYPNVPRCNECREWSPTSGKAYKPAEYKHDYAACREMNHNKRVQVDIRQCSPGCTADAHLYTKGTYSCPLWVDYRAKEATIMNAFCEEKVERNLQAVKNCLRAMIAHLGTGFHPDTDAEQYITLDGKQATFTPTQCEIVNHNLNTINAVLGETVYAEAIELWHEMGMIDTARYLELQEVGTHLTAEQQLCLKLDGVIKEMEKVNLHGTYYVSPPGTSAPAALIMMRGAIPETHEECVEFLSKTFKKDFQFFQEVPLGIITVWSR